MRLLFNFFSFPFMLMLCIFASCDVQKETDGPYFGNGVHNGCADQQSVVIWTRLTKNPEGNAEGEQFLIPDGDEHKQLDREADSTMIMQAQMPEGYALYQMIGACPGAPGEVRLTWFPETQSENKQSTEWIKVDPEKNYTHQWRLSNLESGTVYNMVLEARHSAKFKVSDTMHGAFRTPPEPAAQEEVDFCIVTCHDFIRRDTVGGHRIYTAMGNIAPDFYVHTGDIEYYDKPDPYAMTETLMRFKWDRLFALPLQRDFWSQVTSYFQKDDHDVLRNDAYPGMTYGTVGWERGLEIFDEQLPACDKPYKTVRWGKDLQIWLTEGRVYRSRNTDPDGPGKTIFGEEQKQWLFRTLKESDATFKVVINANPILGPDRKNKSDNYANSNFQYEGDEIRQYLNQFDNVFLCNGDRHWQYVTHWDGTNLWEFSCGAGADNHAGGWNQMDVRPEHRFLRVRGGFLHGNVQSKGGESILTFRHCDVHGNVVHEEVFRKGM
jgi:alkaline phosphatase D